MYSSNEPETIECVWLCDRIEKIEIKFYKKNHILYAMLAASMFSIGNSHAYGMCDGIMHMLEYNVKNAK